MLLSTSASGNYSRGVICRPGRGLEVPDLQAPSGWGGPRARETQLCPDWSLRPAGGARGGAPPPGLSSLVRSRPAPTPFQSQSAIGGGACRSEGAGPRCFAPLVAATAAVLLSGERRAGSISQAASTGDGKQRGWALAVTKFPSPAGLVSPLPATRDRLGKDSGILNLGGKSPKQKSRPTSFSLWSSFSGWPAAGAAKLCAAAHTARRPAFGET